MSRLFILKFSLFIFISVGIAQQNSINKKLDDDNTKYTNIGNIGLTITNFGTFGHGFSLWPKQPSCEYPFGSGIEHIFDGGLWIGSFKSNDSLGTGKTGPYVSTGAVDAASVSARGGGFEYTNSVGSKITETSSLLDAKFYNPYSISHQDFVMNFVDTNKTLSSGEPIIEHSPLGISVDMKSYAWNYSFANNFVILDYWIKNVSNKYLDSVYVGLWTDAVVRNTNITSPKTGATFFDKSGDGFSDSMKIAYEFDATGDIGFTDSYVGIQFLGTSVKVDSINFVSWQFRNTTDPNFFAPQNDFERYRKMQGFFGGDNRYYNISQSSLKTPSNRSLLITCGPIKKIPPKDSVNIVYSILTAKKFGTDPASLDSKEQKKNLYTSAEWALRAYYGEDRNRNGVLDFGEDLDGNGKITRYILPTPPNSPKIKVIPQDRKVTIYWDKRAENSIDPITGLKDFEGYKLYRTNSGFDLTATQNLESSFIQMAVFDSAKNNLGYNTGFKFIELKDPITFANDETKYYYKFEVDNLLNGWLYVFSVTAFDKGDQVFNLESLESSNLSNSVKIIPGVLASNSDDIEIGVYPNPYYGNAYWDGSSERLRKIYFYNIPEECEITIYTLSGDVVKRIYHNKNSNGSDLKWFQTYSKDGSQIMSGGEHPWDLLTDNDQAIATGLYLYTVKNNSNNKIKSGKFLIIK